MGREVRRVPKDWQHPRNDRGQFIPMRDGSNREYHDEFAKNVVLWECGAHPSQRDDWTRENCRHYWDWNGLPVEYGERGCCMFDEPRDDLTHFMLYESTSEGTPCENCPAFATIDELIDWAAKNATTFGSFRATRDEWSKMLGNGFGCHAEGNLVFC